MASTKNKQSLSDMVYDIKQKITDEEYKNIMDEIAKIEEKKYVKIRYMIFDWRWSDDCDDNDEKYPVLTNQEYTKICQVSSDEDERSIYWSIKLYCRLHEDHLEFWNKIKDEKERWPMTYKSDINQGYILICDFEEL